VSFQIVPLRAEEFAALSRLDARALSHRLTADARAGFLCRVSLRDADPGDELLLVHYPHQEAESPYRAGGPIFAGVNRPTAHLAPDEVPPMLRTRLLSVRGFSERGWIEFTDVTQGKDRVTTIDRAFGAPGVAHLHLHFARPGCDACRVDRAEPA